MSLPLDPPDFWDVHRRDCPMHEKNPYDSRAKCLCRELSDADKDDADFQSWKDSQLGQKT